MNYITRAISLISKSKVLDRVLVAEVNPPLYFFIEIKAPWFPSNALAYKIVQTIKDKYNEGIPSPATNFEEGAEAVNETLAKLTEEGQTEWLGNLSAIITLIDNDKINLTSVGTATCYLIRDQNAIEITEDQPKEAHPLKTFSHILSGDLKKEDKLIIGNHDFFESLSLDYLKQVLTKEPTKAACGYICRSLQKDRVKTASALILEIKKGPSTSSAPTSSVIYIDERKFLPRFWQRIKQFLLATVGFLEQEIKQLVIFLGRTFRALFFKIATSSFFKKNKKWILLGVSLLLLLVLAFSILSLVQKQRMTGISQTQRKAIIEAEGLEKDAQESLVKGNKEEAKKLLSSALSLVSQIKNKEGVSLSQKIESQLDKLNNVVRIKPKEIFDFQKSFGESAISQIFVIDKTIYSIDTKTNKIYKQNESPTSLPQYSGQFVSGVYQSPERLLIFYQDLEGIYEYKIEENKLEKAKIVFEGKWGKAKILGNYFTNIYLLDPKEGQIYKHEKTAAGYSKGLPYVNKDKVDLKKAVSMALDGFLYVLNSDGVILKLMAGRPVSDFSVKGIPEPETTIRNPVKIFTSPDIPNLYLLDGSRILELGKSGNYLRMFILEAAGPKDLWVNYKNKKIYLLSDSKVYELGL